MKAISTDEVRSLEKFAVDIGIPLRSLMEMAGMKVASIAQHEVKKASYATVICGSGGNGGDGFVAARYLHNSGINVDIYLLCAKDEIRNQDSKANYMVLEKLGIKVKELTVDSIDLIKNSLLRSDIVIDAVYGIGLKGEPSLLSTKAITMINMVKSEVKSRRKYLVISIDVPSGINGTTGETAKAAVEADITITFEYPKIGLMKYPASKFAGKVITTGIGIPKPNPIETMSVNAPQGSAPGTLKEVTVTDANIAASMLPRRKNDANKGDNGKVLVYAGSSGMAGAGLLCAKAALRSGAGLVVLAVPKNIKDTLNAVSAEVIVADRETALTEHSDADCILIGPGLTTSAATTALVKKILSSKAIKCPIVMDADALNVIKDPKIFKSSKKQIVITPHPGEFSRLTKKSVQTIETDRIAFAKYFSSKYGVITVLKGAYTVICNGSSVFVNPTGHPGMATAGSGDVLAGVIASLIGQKSSIMNASVAGVFVHGLSGNLVASYKGEIGIIASDLIEWLPQAINSLK
jgi:ADP-dependent NAD(P)H-hydrate dehydratase / NAD(P)H-hydrate epimerase